MALCIKDFGLVLDYTTVYLHRICVIEFSVVTQDCIMGERIRIMLRIAFWGLNEGMGTELWERLPADEKKCLLNLNY